MNQLEKNVAIKYLANDGGTSRNIMAGKANPFTEYLSFSVRMKLCFLHNGRDQCTQLPTRWLTDSSENDAKLGAQWHLLLADWTFISNSNQFR